jgi:hypothetical protein
VVGCCKYGNEPAGSGATELVSKDVDFIYGAEYIDRCWALVNTYQPFVSIKGGEILDYVSILRISFSRRTMLH